MLFADRGGGGGGGAPPPPPPPPASGRAEDRLRAQYFHMD